ncbi:MAG: hypothetical protein B6I30_00320 [Desulfobacteraceae bacterium 4572_187]|nr:MAG: hypothetical protein B6I30_00320 [Desulfobacteraceae bacterium 4572_187]
MFRSNITTGILAVLFFVTVVFSLSAYNRYLAGREKVETLTVRLRLMEEQKIQLERKRRILLRVKKFIDKADALGLEESRWATYEVNIAQGIAFFEMEQIVNQCVNTPSYYFRPVSLHTKINGESDNNENQGKPDLKTTESLEDQVGDVILTLKGAFVVRHK